MHELLVCAGALALVGWVYGIAVSLIGIAREEIGKWLDRHDASEFDN